MSLFEHRTLLRNLLPGLVLPGLIYLLVSRTAPTLVALAVASSVPVLDAMWRVARRQRPSAVGVFFIGLTGVSVGLAMWLHSPMFILLKGAAISAVVGLAFTGSALVRRPLTRTLALHLSSHGSDDRHRLAERWRHPKTIDVFCTLSAAWGIWLLLTAGQQLTLALTVSPGTVMLLDGPVHFVATGIGIVASIAYVRRRQVAHPEMGLLPIRVR
jgi:hypothetical protein